MLPTGHDVCSQLLKAIEESEIYALVFSIKYAASERCLDELVDIMDCYHKFDQRKILPIFFNVETTDVKNQRGSYKEAFEAHKTNFDARRVDKWRQALKEASGISGGVLQNGCSNDDMPPLSFKRLRSLTWKNFPLKFINIDMCNVVYIELKFSKLEKLWEGKKSLKKLRVLNVSCSHSLTKTGDFSGLENLEELDFSRCRNLEKLHSSVGCLDKLEILSVGSCKRLNIPCERIGKLRSLRRLRLSCPNMGLECDEVMDLFLSSLKECRITHLYLGWCKISKISDEIGNLTWLEDLDLEGNKFPSLPHSLGQLHQLKKINLSDCATMQSIAKFPQNLEIIKARCCRSLANLPSNMSELEVLRELWLDDCDKLGSEDPECLMKFTGLQKLSYLSMKNCNVSQVPDEIGNLLSLSDLDLSGNTFPSLPDSFSNLLQLTCLVLYSCSQLRFLPPLPSKLKHIGTVGCCSLVVMPVGIMQMTDNSLCPKSIWSSCHYEFNREVPKVYTKSPFISRLTITLDHWDEVSNWCSYWSNGDTLSFVAPQDLSHKKIYGMILCATVDDANEDNRWWKYTPEILNKTKETSHKLKAQEMHGNSMCVMFCPLDDTTLVIEAGDSVEVLQGICSPRGKIKYGGLCLIYEDDEVHGS